MNFQLLKQKLKYLCETSTLRYFLQSPSLIFAISQNLSKFYFLKTVESVLDSNFVSCLYNFGPSERFLDHLKERRLSHNGFWRKCTGAPKKGINLLLYLIVRKYKPEIVVETGVAYGASSAFILCAMHENSKGHLYSIDLPPYEAPAEIEITDEVTTYLLKDGQRHKWGNKKNTVGHLVPEYLKERWTLILGDAKNELPRFLKKINKVSMFLHDSLHTYEHMMFEYETVWPYLIKGGLLLSHDVLWNKAFLDFSKKVHSKRLIYYSLGVIKKS